MAEPTSKERPPQVPALILYWVVVGVPLAWGLFSTLQKAALLFR
jgi:hypothetical protein